MFRHPRSLKDSSTQNPTSRAIHPSRLFPCELPSFGDMTSGDVGLLLNVMKLYGYLLPVLKASTLLSLFRNHDTDTENKTLCLVQSSFIRKPFPFFQITPCYSRKHAFTQEKRDFYVKILIFRPQTKCHLVFII